MLQLRQLRVVDGPATVAPTRSARAAWVVAAAAVVAGAAIAVVGRRAPVSPPVLGGQIRFEVLPPAGLSFWDNLETVPLAVAPDGSRVGFVATDGRVQRIWLRTMGGVDATPVNDLTPKPR